MFNYLQMLLYLETKGKEVHDVVTLKRKEKDG